MITYQSPYLYGMEILIVPNTWRYTLPEELLPGVPWPAGFRDSFNEWAHTYLGSTSVIPNGHALVSKSTGPRIFISPELFKAIKDELRLMPKGDTMNIR